MKRFAIVGLLASLSGVGCVEQAAPRAGGFSEDNVGVAQIALSSVPPSVRCVRVSHRPSSAGVETLVSNTISAGADSAKVLMRGLPLGTAMFTVFAYNAECGAVTATTQASWQSATVTTQLRVDRIPDVPVTLYPVRSTEVQASFQRDFEEVHQCGLALIGVDSVGSMSATGIAEIATIGGGRLAGTLDVGCSSFLGCSVQPVDNAVYCWGINTNSMPSTVTSASSSWIVPNVLAEQVDVGIGVSCAITTDGGVRCWGNNSEGLVVPSAPAVGYVAPVSPPNLPTGNARWQDVAVGHSVACALSSQGVIRCWGRNLSGELGSATARESAVVSLAGVTNGVVDLAASVNGMYALKANGQIARWGDGVMTPINVPGIDDAIGLAAASGSACALRENGQVVCWGRGERGQHGDGLVETNRGAPGAPVELDPALGPVLSITGAGTSFCALHQGGEVSCWGGNSGGNLGDGTVNDAYLPVLAERWDTRIDHHPLF